MAIVNVFTMMNWASIGKNLITGIGEGIKMEKVSAAVEETLKPGTGYVLKMPPVYDGQKITIMLETTERCCEN